MDNIFWDRLYSPISKKVKNLISGWLHLFKEEADEKSILGLGFPVLSPAFQRKQLLTSQQTITDFPSLSRKPSQDGKEAIPPCPLRHSFSLPLEQQRADAVELYFRPYDPFVTTVTTGVLHIIQDPAFEERLLRALQGVPMSDDGVFHIMDLEKVDYLVNFPSIPPNN